MSYVRKMSDLRLNFWFALNTKQQRSLHKLGYSHLFCEEIQINDLVKVSKSKKIRNMLCNLKKESFRLVA